MRRALVSLNLLYLPMESLLQLQKIQYLGRLEFLIDEGIVLIGVQCKQEGSLKCFIFYLCIFSILNMAKRQKYFSAKYFIFSFLQFLFTSSVFWEKKL